MRTINRIIAILGKAIALIYALWHSASKPANWAYSNAGQTATHTGVQASTIRADTGKSSAKWYWEIRIDATTGQPRVGICTAAGAAVGSLGANVEGWAYQSTTGRIYHNNAYSAFGATYGQGDTIGVALDMDAGTVKFYKNNTLQGTAYTGLSGTLYPAASTASDQDVITAHFTASTLTYSPPAGYTAGLYT